MKKANYSRHVEGGRLRGFFEACVRPCYHSQQLVARHVCDKYTGLLQHLWPANKPGIPAALFCSEHERVALSLFEK